MSAPAAETRLADTTANPAPLGLLGFGMTTVLLNLHNAGLYELDSMILAMGVFYGGLAQILAGLMEWKKNNTFGTTAFTSYGLFWLSLVALILGNEYGLIASATLTEGLIAYFLMWGLFTGVMFLGTLRLNRALQVVFGSLTLLFVLLAAGEIVVLVNGQPNALLGAITGWEGVLCGASAVYTALAQVLNELYDRTVLPLGPVKPEKTAPARSEPPAPTAVAAGI